VPLSPSIRSTGRIGRRLQASPLSPSSLPLELGAGGSDVGGEGIEFRLGHGRSIPVSRATTGSIEATGAA
jgi:hypothetical protein